MERRRAAKLAENRRLWKAHLSKWESSGLSQLEFCRRNNIKVSGFQYWKQKLLPKPSAATLVELPIASPLHPLPFPVGPRFCLVIDGRYQIEITPGFDADTLDRLIRVLNRP